MHGGRFQCCKACRPGKKMKKKLGGLNRASSTPRHPHSKTDGRKGDERLEQDGELLYEPKQFDVSVCLRRRRGKLQPEKFGKPALFYVKPFGKLTCVDRVV